MIDSRACAILPFISLLLIASPAAALESFARDDFARTTLALGSNAQAHAVALQPDGAMVVAASADSDFKLVR
ncbi:MAG: hypothetical protein LBV36_00685, partial [Chromatiales bacterium]|nr:hypothetical protein [Chromatiales bacterium]